MTVEATREHEICCGHRVVGHNGKCRNLHGHNYKIKFICEGEINSLGMVIDFSDIKAKLCNWLEENWDHKFLIWRDDPWLFKLKKLNSEGICVLDYNPTAENLAKHLVKVIGPKQLEGTGIILKECTIYETSKCSATYWI